MFYNEVVKFEHLGINAYLLICLFDACKKVSLRTLRNTLRPLRLIKETNLVNF